MPKLTTDDLDRIKAVCEGGNYLDFECAVEDPRTGYAALAERMRPVVEAYQDVSTLDDHIAGADPYDPLDQALVTLYLAVKRAVEGESTSPDSRQP